MRPILLLLAIFYLAMLVQTVEPFMKMRMMKKMGIPLLFLGGAYATAGVGAIAGAKLMKMKAEKKQMKMANGIGFDGGYYGGYYGGHGGGYGGGYGGEFGFGMGIGVPMLRPSYEMYCQPRPCLRPAYPHSGHFHH